jgi:hypothetical protein
LTIDEKIINYNICPLNLVINEYFQLKLVDLSLVDFFTVSHYDDSSIDLKKENSELQIPAQTPIIMRAKFITEINVFKE